MSSCVAMGNHRMLPTDRARHGTEYPAAGRAHRVSKEDETGRVMREHGRNPGVPGEEWKMPWYLKSIPEGFNISVAGRNPLGKNFKGNESTAYSLKRRW